MPRFSTQFFAAFVLWVNRLLLTKLHKMITFYSAAFYIYVDQIMSDEKNFTAPFFNNTFLGFFEKYQGFPNSFQGLIDIQVKNIRSINHVQQTSMENFQEIVFRQNEIFSQIMQQTTAMANDITENATPEDTLKKNALHFQKSYENALTNVKEISELIKKSNLEATKILRKRAAESLKEVKDCTQKKTG